MCSQTATEAAGGCCEYLAPWWSEVEPHRSGTELIKNGAAQPCLFLQCVLIIVLEERVHVTFWIKKNQSGGIYSFCLRTDGRNATLCVPDSQKHTLQHDLQQHFW